MTHTDTTGCAATSGQAASTDTGVLRAAARTIVELLELMVPLAPGRPVRPADRRAGRP